MMQRYSICALCLWLAGCATFNPPAAPQPDPATLPAMHAPQPMGLDRWWTAFDDPQLDALIDEALANNLDLRVAMRRLEEARAGYRLARAARFPSLDLAASATRNRASEIGPNPLPPGFAPSTTGYRATLDLSWEIDLWGRVAAAARGAAERYRATQADTAGARASIAAQLARSWFQLRALDAELALVERILAGREQSLQLIGQRFGEGSTGRYELALARAERDAALAALPPLRQARAQAESAIAALSGRTPAQVFSPDIARGRPLETLDITLAVPAGLDAELLARRPDVISAEAGLLASEWDLRAARAAFFPRISLTGLLGYESGDLGELLSAPARLGQVALGAVQPIAGLATLGAARDVAAAQREQQALAYQQTLLNAFRETHDALVAVRENTQRQEAEQARLASYDEVVSLARLRFDAGYSAFLDVLDNERDRDAAASALIQARRDRLLAIVDLYLALGGGWSELPEASAVRGAHGAPYNRQGSITP